jgi:hypothetical protein
MVNCLLPEMKREKENDNYKELAREGERDRLTVFM